MRHYSCIFLIGSVILFSQCAWSNKQFSSEKSDWEKSMMQSQSGPVVYRLDDIVDTTVTISDQKTIRPPVHILMKEKEKSPVSTEEKSVSVPVSKQSDSSTLSLNAWIGPELWEQCFPKRFGVAEKGTNSKEQGFKDFFTYDSFMEAAARFPKFLNEGSIEDRRRELAAFFAHITMETGGLRYKEQLNKRKSYSVPHAQYPPVSARDYHGRGPIQLSYNYNYGLFSEHCYGDKMLMLKDPDIILSDSVVAFTSAIWFWMTPQGYKPACHDVMVGTWIPQQEDIDANRLPGFGLTVNIINAPLCGVEPLEPTKKRFKVYEEFCTLFGVNIGPNAICQEQVPYGKK